MLSLEKREAKKPLKNLIYTLKTFAICSFLWYTKQVGAALLYATLAKVSARLVTKFNPSLLDKTTHPELSIPPLTHLHPEISRLHDLLLPLSASQDMSSILKAILSAVLDIQNAAGGVLLLRLPETKEWTLAASRNFPTEKWEVQTLPEWDTLLAPPAPSLLHHFGSLSADVFGAAIHHAAEQAGWRSATLLPLSASNASLSAVVLAFFSHPAVLAASEGAVLRCYTEHAAAALERAQQWEIAHIERQELQRQKNEKIYLAARARCLLWYADVMDVKPEGPYLWWRMTYPANEVTQGFLPLALQEGESYQDGFYRLRHPEDRDACDVLGTASVRAGRSYSQDFRCQCADGSIRWLHEDVQVETVIPGRQWRVVGACTDVTERKLQEEALRESRQRLHSAMHAGQMGVWDWNLLSGEIAWSGEHARLFGLPPEEFDGTYAGFERCVHPEEREGIRKTVQTAIQTRKPYEREYRVIWPDGSLHWVKSMGEASYDAQGQPIRMMGMVLDITARKQAESEISALNIRLQRAMAETHHRVKNNLQVIAALLDIQATQHDEQVPTLVLSQLSRHIQGLATIHDLLTQQIKDGEQIHALSARMVLAKLLPMLQETVGSRNVELDAEDVPITVQQGTAVALITNELVSNAVKHGKGRILVSLAREGDEGVLTVADGGPGFPPQFDITAAAHTGLELVLNMGNWDMGGQLEFANRPEGGAIVTLRFPLIASLAPDALLK